MKIKFSFKKNISGFKPNEHWKIMLVSSFLLFIAAIAYSVYLYAFAKNQINTVTTQEATSTPSELSTLASPEKIQEYFNVYKEREGKYTEIIKSLTLGNKPVATTTISASSSSAAIATSTNQ